MTIKVSPDKIWDFYVENRTAMSDRYLEIAADEELCVSVCITEEEYIPTLLVWLDGAVEAEIPCTTKSEMEEGYQQILNVVLGTDDDEPDPGEDYPDSFDAAEALLCAIQDECDVDLQVDDDLVWSFLRMTVSALAMAGRL